MDIAEPTADGFARSECSMRGRVEAGEVKPFGVVLFENTREEVASKSEAWYFPHAYDASAP